MAVFDADAISLHQLFISEGNNIGFRVPEYQRTYDWGSENIRRYFEDLLSGIRERVHDTPGDQQTLTFLGTIILVDEGSERESTFDGRSFSIVDGQQRLTTAALLALQLHDAIGKEVADLPNTRPEVDFWLRAESQHVLKRLANCIFGNLSPDGVQTFPYPRIVRVGDNRASTSRGSEYRSLIGKYLFSYAEHVRAQTFSPFKFDDSGFKEGTSQRFFKNVLTIQESISDIASADPESSSDLEFEPLVPSDFKHASILRSFEKLPDDQNERNRVVSHATNRYGPQTLRLLRMLSFAVYSLDAVLVTRVQTPQEKYAFDIFDALNTTGEPLTAIETFKPRITLFENQPPRRGYGGSQSETYLRVVEDYIGTFEKNADRQSEAQDIVVSFALYLTGHKCSRHLNAQRRYLRSTYNSVEEGSDREKRLFVRGLADIAEFRKLFWTNPALDSELISAPQRDQVLLCLAVLRAMNNSLTLPIICRYYVVAREARDFQSLTEAIKAITAFVVLRRSATGGTQGIDTDLRAIMARGFPAKDSKDGLHIGAKSDRPLPEIDKFKEMLRHWLAKPPVYVTDRDTWLAQAATQGLYSNSQPLCRFLLLAAAHNARPSAGDSSKLEKVRVSRELDYLNYKQWKAKENETIEHIAPQSDRGRNWDNAIYAQPHLKNSIGNLILLPGGENSAVGNRPWSVKKLFYQAFAAEQHDRVRELLAEAEQQGVDFGRAKKMLLENVHLPFARTIAECRDWNAAEIEKRTQNILELAWDDLSGWLF